MPCIHLKSLALQVFSNLSVQQWHTDLGPGRTTGRTAGLQLHSQSFFGGIFLILFACRKASLATLAPGYSAPCHPAVLPAPCRSAPPCGATDFRAMWPNASRLQCHLQRHEACRSTGLNVSALSTISIYHNIYIYI